MTDKRAAAAAEREKIAVTMNNPPEPKDDTVKETEGSKDDDQQNDEEDTSKVEENSEENNDENNEDGEGEKDDTEETEGEEKEAADDKTVEKLQRTIARLQRRLGKESGDKKDLRKQLEDVQKLLAAKESEEGEKLTEEDVNARAKRIANEELTKREFSQACDRLEKAAIKADKDFSEKIDELAADIGAIPGQLIGMLDDLDNGGAVLAYLANNPDEAEDIWGMKNIVKQASAIVKLGQKVEAEEKKKSIKQISKVPPPKQKLGGNGNQPTFDPYNTKTTSDKDWIEQRNKQAAERRAQKLAAMR